MLLLNLILLIDVTFSTPTPDFVNNLLSSPTSVFVGTMDGSEGP
jgi:hypothetical protein